MCRKGRGASIGVSVNAMLAASGDPNGSRGSQRHPIKTIKSQRSSKKHNYEHNYKHNETHGVYVAVLKDAFWTGVGRHTGCLGNRAYHRVLRSDGTIFVLRFHSTLWWDLARPIRANLKKPLGHELFEMRPPSDLR